MPRESTGEVRFLGGVWTARIRIKSAERHSFDLPTCRTKDEALERAAILAKLAKRFRIGNISEKDRDNALDAVASATERSLRVAMTYCQELLGGELDDIQTGAEAPTFEKVANDWTSGELRKRYPDHVEKLTEGFLDTVKSRLKRGIFPVLGSLRVTEITREDCDAVMRQLPLPAGKDELSKETRRQYAAIINRVLNLAELAGHIQRSPLPRGWLPKPGPKKRFPILYPGEDATLLACAAVPFAYRILYGFLHREGMRRGEVAALQWRDLDLENETISLDENKTDHPRWWRLSPGVADALAAWASERGNPEPGDAVFIDEHGRPLVLDHLADVVRGHLVAAGLKRADLTSSGPNKGPFGVHCFRRSFVTRSLALGKNEDFVRQRTGHKSDELLTYRQAAKALGELDLGELTPLDVALSDCPGITPRFVEPRGIEPLTSSMPFRDDVSEHSDTKRDRVDAIKTRPPSSPIVESRGQSGGNEEVIADPVETALGDALRRASAAGQWTVVEALSRELTARREARAGVVAIGRERAKQRR